MLNLEIDGKPVQVAPGSTVMDAATALDIYVPHFCYHRKLTIAANCRMCLVQVEKAPKPLPACATPATEGMKVWTHSKPATDAQKGVMEFLLINHPLDCPICDQGGECQLQDLAVGYGASSSRYDEPKRVVFNKNLGPLIATDMTRCIHCTRCVRFGQEIAGVMELGMANRGEHAEIMTFVGRTVDSELSGNMIDLCPVGALTSKPFRYSARTWELARRKTVSPHDGLGSNLIAHIKNDRVMRVVPMENEAINECWISDRDRFSYDGLNSEQRLLRPMVKRDGVWQETDWQAALDHVVAALRRVRDQSGGKSIGALAAPHATTEELYLLQKLARGLGSDNVDFRLRRSEGGGAFTGAVPWLGMSITDFAALDRYLVIGSFLRKDQPLLSHRVRQATKRGAELSLLHVVDDDLLMRVANKSIVAPSALVTALAAIVAAARRAPAEGATAATAATSGGAVDDAATRIAASLANGKAKGIFLGSVAQNHPQAAALHALAQQLAEATGATLGFLTEGANTVGAHLVGALPADGGLDAGAMLAVRDDASIPAPSCCEAIALVPLLAEAALVPALLDVAVQLDAELVRVELPLRRRHDARVVLGVVDDLGGLECFFREDLGMPVRRPALVHDLGHALRCEVVGLVADDLEDVALPALERRVLDEEQEDVALHALGVAALLVALDLDLLALGVHEVRRVDVPVHVALGLHARHLGIRDAPLRVVRLGASRPSACARTRSAAR